MNAHYFHVDLSDAVPDHDYIVVAVDHEQLLTAHTEESRQMLSAAKVNSALGARLAQTTHFTADAVMMPASCAYRVHVKAVPRDPSQPEFVHAAAIIVPKPDLAASESMHAAIDWVATAQAFLFHHPDLQTTDPNVSAMVMEHLDFEKMPSNYALIEELALQMRIAGTPTTDPNKGWATLVPMETDEGTVHLQQPTQFILDQAGDAMTAVMISTKNDPRLKDEIWMFTPGVSTESSSANTPQFAAAIRTGDTAGAWKATVDNIHSVFGMEVSVTVLDPSKRQVRIRIKNSYIRYLGAYIQFLDADMNPLSTPGWRPDGGKTLLDTTQYDNFRALGTLRPVTTVMGIPVNDPGTLDVQVTFPPGAVAAGVFGCGLSMWSSRPFPKANVYGGILTALANLTIPSILLTTGVIGGTYKSLYERIAENPQVTAALLHAGGRIIGLDGGTNIKPDWSTLSTLGHLLFNEALYWVLAWVKAQLVAGTLRNSLPFAGWMVLAISSAASVFQITLTITHVAMSPWNIPNRLSTTIDSTVTIHPDPRSGVFPQPPAGSEASCTVNMIFNSPRPTVIDTLTPAQTDTKLATRFTNQLGGRVKFEANFYIGTWLAATASTGWLKNDQDNTANVTLVLVQNPVPLTDKSVYVHSQILTYQNGRYQWMASGQAPTSTIADGDSSQTGNFISVWQGLTLSQRNALLGWAWKAAGLGIPSPAGTTGTQLFAMQAIDTPGREISRAPFPPAGFDAPNNILFDPYPPKFKMGTDGRWELVDNRPVPDPKDVDLGMYWIDPRKSALAFERGGGYHLRKFDGSFNTSPGQPSWGRFPWAPDSLVLHPTGHVVAIHTRAAKIMVLKIAENGAADDALPLAQTFAGKGIDFEGSRGRAGLLVNPVAVTCSYDGTVLILEWLSSDAFKVARIQAFDLYGNPVNAFRDSAGNASPFLPIDPSRIYLDITCSGNQDLAYIHVLSYRNPGRKPSDYDVSIYQYGKNATAKNPLVTTIGLSAASIVTDMWNSLYALNWEMTTDGKDNEAGPKQGSGVGPAGRTVPSISVWRPPEP